jgi:serine/threonine protein kinase
MAPIVDAVGYLHKQQPPIIHRDIKPANIIVPDAVDDSVLVDFGIAKEYEQDGTTTAVRRCSPGYGAPEQYARGTTQRTDIYGLGATFYALLTGTIPADALYRLTQMGSKNTDPLEDVAELAPDVPQHVAVAIHRAMRIDSNERFATVGEFWQALNTEPIAEPSVSIVPVAASAQKVPVTPIVTKRSVTVVPQETIRSLEERRPRRNRILVALLVLLALLALISGIAFSTNFFRGSYSKQAASATTIPRPPATPSHSSTTVSPTATQKPRPSPTIAPTVTQQPTTQPTSQPTTAPAGFATLGKTYNGKVTNTFVIPNETANIQLNNIIQNRGSISSGNLYVDTSTGLQGSGPLTGSVTANSIQFTVQERGIDSLFFSGTIRADRSMYGTYYSIKPDGSRDYSQGYGTWFVNPPSA